MALIDTLSGPWDGHGVPFQHRGRSSVDKPTWAAIEQAEALAGFTFIVTQGRNPGGVAASAGTHNGWGVVDLHARGLGSSAVAQMVLALRKVGTTAWHRFVSQGFPVEHVHFNLIDHPDQSGAAQRQIAQYRAGCDGLADHGPDYGPDGYHHWDWPSYFAAHHGHGATPEQSPAGPSRTTMQQVGITNPPANSVHDAGGNRAPFTLSLTGLQMAAEGKPVTGQYADDVQHALGTLRVLLPGAGTKAGFRDMYAAWQRHLGYSGQQANGIPGQTSLVALAKRAGYKVVA